jgi:hypothetical protein
MTQSAALLIQPSRERTGEETDAARGRPCSESEARRTSA